MPETLKKLSYGTHGLSGTSLGVSDGIEWALTYEWDGARNVPSRIYRRAACGIGLRWADGEEYGGWRWECSVAHAREFMDMFPACVRQALGRATDGTGYGEPRGME